MNLYRSNKKSGPTINVQSSKTVTAGTSQKTVSPDTGYDAMGEVVVNPTPSQSKSVTATTSVQTVVPDSGKLLSQVTVNPQSHSATMSPVTSNGTVDLGEHHNYRYIPVNVAGVPDTLTIGFQDSACTSSCAPTINVPSDLYLKYTYFTITNYKDQIYPEVAGRSVSLDNKYAIADYRPQYGSLDFCFRRYSTKNSGISVSIEFE